LSLVSVKNSRNRSSMKTGLHTGRARTICDAPFRNGASFTAKRLIMVEYVQKNGTNKEIRRSGQAEAPRKESINDWALRASFTKR
ncbi:hypothetical protein, partial [Bradyrhizobium sp. 1]|uniref:hypothetical protein n=1 Tax=Bradyrhizobium sp. 1 TaxID=241591 RepID=UPI001FFA1792